MLKKQFICVLLLLECFAYSLHSQINNRDSVLLTKDTLKQAKGLNLTVSDSVTKLNDKFITPKITQAPDSLASKRENRKKIVAPKDSIEQTNIEFKPSPKKAVIYSAIFPGLGQFYNRKYWKLPIVYGGIVGISYAITWNQNMYSDYMNAYKDLATGQGDSWMNLGIDPNRIRNDKARYIERFRSAKNTYKRNRDLAIICAIGVYGICMLDAYVDAQLYDFDISPDLSMKVMPVIFEPTNYSDRSIGLQLSFNF